MRSVIRDIGRLLDVWRQEPERLPPAVDHPPALTRAFDPAFYRLTNPDLPAMEDAALFAHFLSTGWQEGRDGGAGFSIDDYLAANPDVAEAGLNPLAHYVLTGRAEGRSAWLSHWRQDGATKLEASHLALVSPQFDSAHYAAGLPEELRALGPQALAAHFLMVGWREGRDPNPNFSIADYLCLNPDVAEAGVNPFLHYLQVGHAEQRRLHSPLEEAAPDSPRPEVSQEDLANIAPYFDATFYRARYPHVPGSDADLARHYMSLGWRQGFDPSEEFSTSYYLVHAPDLIAADINPLLHYALAGRAEGRVCRPTREEITAARREDKVLVDVEEAAALSEPDLEAVIAHFDAAFYRASNEDLEGSDAELLLHYMTRGWRELRDPSADFSTSYYLEAYRDIVQSGVNPFLHYVLFGRAEGRRSHSSAAVGIHHEPEADLVPALSAAIEPRRPASRSPVPPARVNTRAMDIHWLVPDFSRGGGGHMTIFRMVRFLESFGHRCTIWIDRPTFHDSGEAAWEDIVKYYQCVRAKVRLASEGLAEARGDVILATGWATAWQVEALTGFAEKFYFVQDHEPEFFPTGAEAMLARATYGFDFACICASPWLKTMMEERYGRWARAFWLAYDPEHYRLLSAAGQAGRYRAPSPSRPARIAVYARAHTDRRCVDLALLALQILARERQDFEVHFFGQDKLDYHEAPFRAEDHGVLDAPALAELYNDCDVGICFSGTNYSLVPQEMMACGLPVLELDGDSTRAIFPPGVTTLAGPAPADIAARLAELIDMPERRRTQAEEALAWVRQFSWEQSAREVEAALVERVSARQGLAAPAGITRRRKRMDVVIPTYNGVGEIEPVIAALRTQRMAEEMQIHCIDSSSSDGTTSWLRAQRDVSLTVIDQAEFQHGRTRNHGASLGDAPIIAFLTQDARPTSATWAGDLAKMLDHHEGAAGVFGRHAPYPDHPVFVRREIEQHFENLLKYPLALSRDTDRDRWESGDRGWRQLLHFYSDNNSAMRRTVWREIPYPEIDYGEDQVWARDIIEAGYAKLYAPTAAVYHSHDYGPEQTYERCRIEGGFFYRHFGYQLGAGSQEEVAARVKREQAEVKAQAARDEMSEEEVARRLANIAEKYRGWRDGLAEAVRASSSAIHAE
ncbi:glycosyltransferase [Pseudoroseicyclus tamaricis]|uniref:Glycosyltransferase n=1 Tax=Pseudoroseicyclus tamaricis TaxID=2705421 RepID=A0A6B2JZ73_9RHOB|nr:glycosyltransferase [Pseudoroseicyclus tamaricis]NDU99425.1 glycosyltransferase [Pseudoroseicyclus tamaricis]